jgi:transposase
MNATLKTVVRVDTAKSVFQVYTVEQATGEVINKPIKRAQFLQPYVRWQAPAS